MKPIIFSSEMVKAILEGRKSQTRRVVKPQPDFGIKVQSLTGLAVERFFKRCPYGSVGDMLWVRETWQYFKYDTPPYLRLSFKATQKYIDPNEVKWKSPLFLPKNMSRITLEITDIRVERLLDITPDDCVKEGMEQPKKNTAGTIQVLNKFTDLWNSLAKKGFKWEDNPWVWVVSFKKVSGEGIGK